MNNLKLTLGLLVALVLTNITSVVLADNSLSADEIFKRAREKYASLTSYQDEGKSVSILNGSTITTAFKIKLARPNLYRIEWEQSTESAFATTKQKKQTVWSAGKGDYLDMGFGSQKQNSQEIALASATGISGSAAATIPGTFFVLNWGNQLGGAITGQKAQADEKVAGVDCYVFSSELSGRIRTIWIGKQDYLIHQVQNVTSPAAMKAMMDEMARKHPEMAAQLQKTGNLGMTSTETHDNIVVNAELSAKDFGK